MTSVQQDEGVRTQFHPHSLVRLSVKHIDDHWEIRNGDETVQVHVRRDGTEEVVDRFPTQTDAYREANRIANRWRANNAAWQW